jgi:hypothetical protein
MEQPADRRPAVEPIGAAPRRAYSPPRLIVHGTVQTLTHEGGGLDTASGLDTR